MSKPPTDDQLKGMAAHVEYEIGEFRNSVRKFAELKTRADADISEKNRALESALLHFRILRGFFCGEAKPGQDWDDVFASDYCARASWVPKHKSVFNSTGAALNKRLAHLSLARLTGKNWDELDFMNEAINANVEHFAKTLPAAREHWFPTLSKPATSLNIGPNNNSTTSPTIIGLEKSFDGVFVFSKKLEPEDN